MLSVFNSTNTTRASVIRIPTILVASACLLFSALLTACGSTASTGAKATATPTCPPVVATKTITGTIQTVTANTLTVTPTSGASAIVHLTSTTRITREVQVAASTLAAGSNVQVTTDAAGITAQRITVVGSFGNRTGGTGATGTPTTRRNAACLRRASGGGSGQGTFQGLRGTISSVGSTQMVITDTQGQSFTLAITPATVIISTTTAQSFDLTVGASIVAIGIATSDGITARTIAILLPGSSS